MNSPAGPGAINRWLYPPVCVLCGGPGAGVDLCRGCADELPWLTTACDRCARPLALAGTCGPCQRRPPPFDAAVAAFEYGAPVDWLVQRFKFDDRLSIGRVLGGCLAKRIATSGAARPDALLPVPLHGARLRSRGYDQALEIATHLSRQLAIQLQRRALRRVRKTPEQSGLSARSRRVNLRGAFRVAGKLPAHVALVDDVMTTASTVAACAATLKRSGVERVDVWVIARA